MALNHYYDFWEELESTEKMKPAKRIAISDTSTSFVENILEFVEDKYNFIITDDRNADYVFHSEGSYDVLKYTGIRIFITGENVTPNFAISDYAMAFDKIIFGDRYKWLPLIKLYRNDYKTLVSRRPPTEEVLATKKNFCAYVMSNTKNSAKERSRIFDLLSEYKQVNSGGKWKNNVGGPVPDKLAFQSSHKFVIACENSSSPGYLTEKFAHAAASNAIPIYWGDTDIGKIFNSKAFVNCHAFNTLEDMVEEVKRIDNDESLYRSMLSEPWFTDSKEPECLKDEAFSDFLCNVFNQNFSDAFRRNRSRWGIKTEKLLYEMSHKPHIYSLKLIRSMLRNFKNSIFTKNGNKNPKK